MEETRTRAATLLGKVFLQHLTPLASLPTFTALWLTVLDFMEKFMKAATSGDQPRLVVIVVVVVVVV
jgi:brefeldin A-resistance guanine nucleotide exchange factor 1